MNREVFEDAGRLLLRLAVGGLMLFHGVFKLHPGHGVEPIRLKVLAKQLPGLVTYGVYLGEIIAPLLLIAGVATRPAALVMAFNMTMAIWLVHTADIFRVAPTGGWRLELEILYMVGALAIALLGPGRFAFMGGDDS